MSLALIKKDIENQTFPPVYLWYGEDRFSITEAVKKVKEVFLAEDPSGSGIEVLSGKDVSPEVIVEAANTSSFFSRRLVIVDGLLYFSLPRGKGTADSESGAGEEESTENREGEFDVLVEYCGNPNPATCLVLLAEKVNKGRKLYKEIARTGKVIEFSYPKRYQDWQAWVREEVKARGKTISSATAGFLLDWAGHHTGILSQELDKLVLYTGDRGEITREDIAKVCIPMAETTVFSMLDAIAAGSSRNALQKLKEVLSQEHYLKVHTMIVRQIRLLLAAVLIRSQGGSVGELMGITGIRSSFEGKKIFQQAARFSPEKLIKALEECLKTEIALKTGGGSPHLLLEIMIVKFCSK